MNITLNVGAVFQGIMAYWNKIEEATSYTLTLYVLEQNKKVECEIATVVLDRNTRYYTFQGLAPAFEYFVRVEAEDRNGKIIAISDKQKAYLNRRIEVFAPSGIGVYQQMF